NRFVKTHHLPYEALDKPHTLKMAVKGSRSTVKHKCKAKVTIGKHAFITEPMIIVILDTFDALIRYNFLYQNETLIDCKQKMIHFPKQKAKVYCIPESKQIRSAMTAPQDALDFIIRYPGVFENEVPRKLALLRQINDTIR